MNQSGPCCERCGEPARVHITSEVVQDGGIHHLCLSCADQLDEAVQARDHSLNHRAVLICVGAFTLVLSLLADYIGIGRSQGFGWKQDAVLAVGLLLAGAGALIRAMTLLVIGGMITAIALVGDWAGLGDDGGFGAKQMTGAALGLAMIIVGITYARIRRRSASR